MSSYAMSCYAALILLLMPVPLQAADIPRNDGWVTDPAAVLTPAQEKTLEQLMESYKQGTRHEIALLIVPSLEGRPLHQYALEVARDWKIGGKDQHNGALFLVARKERKIRIEVGRGLEGRLTDSICGRIIRDVMVPHFRKQRFYDGLLAGVQAAHQAIGGDYGAIQQARRSRHNKKESASILFVLAFLAVFLLPSLLRGRRLGRGGRRFGYAGMFLGGYGMGRFMGRGGGGVFGGGGGFSGFGGGGGFSGGGASGGW